MIVGFLYGEDIHHLDHLAPLCSLLDISLVVNDEKIFKLAKDFYPNLSVVFVRTVEISAFFLEKVKVIISCLAKPYLNLIFFPYTDVFKKQIKTIWCPHGNSDKGLKSTYFEALSNETCILIYGRKMLEVLKAKKIIGPEIEVIEVGNYRKNYYQKYTSEYQNLIEKYLPTLKNLSNKYLYAPTWEDSENNSSIPFYFEKISNLLKTKETLFIKLHPNTLKKDDLKLNQVIWELEKNHQVHFIQDFPPIYPLLANINAYFGDFSSIGYDALSFKMPMGFLLPEGKTIDDSELFKCGTIFLQNKIVENLSAETIFEKAELFISIQNKLYEYNFSNNENWKENLLKACL